MEDNITQHLAKGDNFEFLGMVKQPQRELTLPLTDMECALIENVFLYSDLIHSHSFEVNGLTYTMTENAREGFKQIFDLLVSIISQDEKAIAKMDEFRHIQSMVSKCPKPHTQRGGKRTS